MAKANDSKPIPFYIMRGINSKISKVQAGMLEHAGSGFPDKGLANSFMLRVALIDLRSTIERALKED